MHRPYLRMPSIRGRSLAFVADDDIWLVELDLQSPGRQLVAQRLTNSISIAIEPRLSPDGGKVAYLCRDHGDFEVYVLDLATGDNRRVTYSGLGQLALTGWYDAEHVLVATLERSPVRSFCETAKISIATGQKEFLPYGQVRFFRSAAAGDVIGRHCRDASRWKRYQGGTAGQLWWRSRRSRRFRRLLGDLQYNLTDPWVVGDRIFFVSDHQGIGNIYSCSVAGDDLKRHSHQRQFYVRQPSCDARHFAYMAGGDLYLQNLSGSKSTRLRIGLRLMATQTKPYYVSAYECLDESAVAPRGEHLAQIIQGHLVLTKPWRGGSVVLDSDAATRYGNPLFSDDGRYLFASRSSSAVDERFVKFDLVSREETVLQQDFGKVWWLATRAGYVALVNHRHELWLIHHRSGRRYLIDRGLYGGPRGIRFSVDGRFLAYSLPIAKGHQVQLKVCEVRRRRVVDLLAPVLGDFSPVFDSSGRYLFFLGIRDFVASYQETHFDLAFTHAQGIYCVALDPAAPDITTCHLRLQDSGQRKGPPRKNQKAMALEDWQLARLPERVRRLPLPLDTYHKLDWCDGRLFYLKEAKDGADLFTYSISEAREELFHREVIFYQISADGSQIHLELTEGRQRLVATDKIPEPDCYEVDKNSGYIATEAIKALIVPRDEWRQMYREAWWLQREHFWDSKMSQIDWHGVYDKYLPLVARVHSRDEFSDLLWEMQGELGTSHCYEYGGYYPKQPLEFCVGKLGAELKFQKAKKAFVITKVLQGDNWALDSGSPLLRSDIRLAKGDAIVAVDGLPLVQAASLDEALASKAGVPVEIAFVRRGKRKTEYAHIKPLRSEMRLRYRDWVATNRAKVAAQTAGRIGYVHIPDMGVQGYEEFYRGFLSSLAADGLILDLRFNGGGHVSQLLLRVLAQRVLGYEVTRWHGINRFPDSAFEGPLVAITNEHAGSDGDIFCHAFKMLGLGPLVGTRTWGGVIGIDSKYQLKDRTTTTQPEYGIWFKDVGFGIENRGTDPDIHIEVTPDDYLQERDPQLDRGIREAQKILAKLPKEKPRFQKPSLRPPRLPKA